MPRGARRLSGGGSSAPHFREQPSPRTHTRQFCARCNSVDRVGFLAPKWLWRLVAGPRWEHDILCLACFAEIGDEKGVEWDVPELEFYPVSYVTLAGSRSEFDENDGSVSYPSLEVEEE